MGKTKMKVVPAVAGAAPPHSGAPAMGLLPALTVWWKKLRLSVTGKEVPQVGGPAPLYEKSCVSQQEAEAFATEMIVQGYHAVVEYNDYDYSWSVEVFDTPPAPSQR